MLDPPLLPAVIANSSVCEVGVAAPEIVGALGTVRGVDVTAEEEIPAP